MIFFKATRSGTAKSKDGAEKDRGTIVHLVTTNNFPSWQKAICGIQPKGNGWYYPDDKEEITCEKCLKKATSMKTEEDAKINYSAVWRISKEVFTQAAAEILNIPIERIEIRRNITSDFLKDAGKLCVYVYREGDNEKLYYRMHNGSVQYANLSPNIHEFKNDLKNELK